MEQIPMNITVYCGSLPGDDPVYGKAARELGSWLAGQGHSLVYGGGKVGLMGIIADAVLQGGGTVTGVIPEFLKTPEQFHTGLTKVITTDSMAQRKAQMIALGDAFIALPGGPGTLEEISEVISLRRLRKEKAPCMVYNVAGYYDELEVMFGKMNEHTFLACPYGALVHFPRNLKEITDILKEEKR
jgi:uncharacterized protein (TIGR00730 family)